MTDTTTSTTTDPHDDTVQEHAVDLAAQAPSPVVLDSSASPGPGYGAAPGEHDPAGQHGLVEHAHGAGADVPLQSRAERPTSWDVAAFPAPTGREEEWRFTPIDLLHGLLEDVVAEGRMQATTSLPTGSSLTEISADEARALGAPEPADRAAALAARPEHGAVRLSVDAEAELTEPVRLTLHGAERQRVQGHVVVTAGRFSKATVVLDHTGRSDYTELLSVLVADGADLTVVSLQRWDDDAIHLAQHDAVVGRDARFKHVVVTLGGSVVRLNTNISYGGPGAEATALGVYFADAGQHLEHRSFVDHNTPRCTSQVTYKGALQGDTAHTVWVGDVLIRAAAEGTSTYELNRNLLLTEGARADSVPNLEIETGLIEGAGHASATGRFDDEQLFYLQARGITEQAARRLVVRGFFNDLVQQIGVPDVQEQLMLAIEDELAMTMVGT
ncbi:Fe-S cluster assembly protein SufD [Angustibacter aerolatus]